MFSKFIRILVLSTLLMSISPEVDLSGQTETEEYLLEGQEDESASELLESLQNLNSNPLDLNRVTLKELQSIPFISIIQAKAIIVERSRNGPYGSWSDLSERLKFDNNMCLLLQPYLTITLEKSKYEESFKIRSRYLKRLQATEGYKKGTYPGSSWKEYQRLTVDFGQDFQCKLLLERDPGELKWNDHLVGYIETNRVPCITRFLVGNFRIEVGQGLVLWGPYGISKGADPVAPIKKCSKGALGYAYSDENSYLTGSAIETEFSMLKLILFVSKTSLDASLGSNGYVKSLNTSGLHRTESEIQRRNGIQETLYGARIMREWSWGKVGITGWQNSYSRKVNPEDPVRHRFDFMGNRNRILGLDYNFLFNRWNISGEIARSYSGGFAIIANSIADYGKMSFVISYRGFDPDFQNTHSLGFGTGLARNEQGIYFGCLLKIFSGTKLNFFYDMFRKPWRTYSIPVPTRGDDLFAQLDKKFSSTLAVSFRTRVRRGEKEGKGVTSSGRNVEILRDRIHHLYRFELRFRPTHKLRLKSRLETIKVYYPAILGEISSVVREESGILIYQDIWYNPDPKFTILARWITFDTDSYDSRVYEFESDLPGVLSIKPLYSKGTRWYIILRWKTFRILYISAKFSSTYHDGADYWGSGNDRIEGDMDRQFGIQVDLKL